MPVVRRAPLRERFEAKVKRSEHGCWRWLGPHSVGGYGFLRNADGGQDYAHRAAYRLFVGEIPPGLEIDHLCRNKGCANPDHLEAVTHAENIRRMKPFSRPMDLGAVCRHGHARTLENIGVNNTGARFCRPCQRANVRASRLKAKVS